MSKVTPSETLVLQLTPDQERALSALLDQKTGLLNVTYTASAIERGGKLKLGYVACNPQFARRAGDPIK
jgi:hypothetical protein